MRFLQNGQGGYRVACYGIVFTTNLPGTRMLRDPVLLTKLVHQQPAPA